MVRRRKIALVASGVLLGAVAVRTARKRRHATEPTEPAHS